MWKCKNVSSRGLLHLTWVQDVRRLRVAENIFLKQSQTAFSGPIKRHTTLTGSSCNGWAFVITGDVHVEQKIAKADMWTKLPPKLEESFPSQRIKNMLQVRISCKTCTVMIALITRKCLISATFTQISNPISSRSVSNEQWATLSNFWLSVSHHNQIGNEEGGTAVLNMYSTKWSKRFLKRSYGCDVSSLNGVASPRSENKDSWETLFSKV